MANSYKNIVITPNIGSSTDDPEIQFSGGNTSVNTDITLKVYPASGGTLSFEGSAGQLFSITNDLTGSIFSVNDVSGIPSIEVFADGTVEIAPYGGNVGVGTLSPLTKLHVDGTFTVGNISNQLLLHPGGSAPTVIHRNDGSTYYILLSAAGTTPSATWNTLRPLYFSTTTGAVTMAHGLSIAGAGLGVGTTASGTNGEIRATNNITAYYSDKRLKKNIKKIENALDKVNSISGVTFQSNEEAAKYGYTDTKTQVGVIAQEIEAVLPEVVVPAPFDIEKDKDGKEYSKSGENYKTVQYEKLTPLLIEAIKELSGRVADLQNQIQELKK